MTVQCTHMRTHTRTHTHAHTHRDVHRHKHTHTHTHTHTQGREGGKEKERETYTDTSTCTDTCTHITHTHTAFHTCESFNQCSGMFSLRKLPGAQYPSSQRRRHTASWWSTIRGHGAHAVLCKAAEVFGWRAVVRGCDGSW